MSATKATTVTRATTATATTVTRATTAAVYKRVINEVIAKMKIEFEKQGLGPLADDLKKKWEEKLGLDAESLALELPIAVPENERTAAEANLPPPPPKRAKRMTKKSQVQNGEDQDAINATTPPHPMAAQQPLSIKGQFDGVSDDEDDGDDEISDQGSDLGDSDDDAEVVGALAEPDIPNKVMCLYEEVKHTKSWKLQLRSGIICPDIDNQSSPKPPLPKIKFPYNRDIIFTKASADLIFYRPK